MAEFEKLDKTVFYYPDAHSIAMATDGKERLRIDSRGQFGFGTKGKPENETVRIAGETDDDKKLALNVTDSKQASLLAVRNDGNVGVGLKIKEPLSALQNSRLKIKGKTSDASAAALSVINANDQSLFVVRNDGNVNYGQLAKLEVVNNFSATIGAADLNLGHSSRRGSPGRALVDMGSELHINYGGDWSQGVRYYISMLLASSEELKENIVELSEQEAVEILSGLNPVQFSFKVDQTQTPHLGFIAEHVPAAIASRDRKAINNDHIVAVLTKVVKEQQKSILALRERVHLLEAAGESRAATIRTRKGQAHKRDESNSEAGSRARSSKSNSTGLQGLSRGGRRTREPGSKMSKASS